MRLFPKTDDKVYIVTIAALIIMTIIFVVSSVFLAAAPLPEELYSFGWRFLGPLFGTLLFLAGFLIGFGFHTDKRIRLGVIISMTIFVLMNLLPFRLLVTSIIRGEQGSISTRTVILLIAAFAYGLGLGYAFRYRVQNPRKMG